MSELSNEMIYWQVGTDGNLTGYHVSANADGTLPADVPSGTYFLMTETSLSETGYQMQGYTTERATQGQVLGASRSRNNLFSVGLAIVVTAAAGIAWVSWFMKMEQNRGSTEIR